VINVFSNYDPYANIEDRIIGLHKARYVKQLIAETVTTSQS